MLHKECLKKQKISVFRHKNTDKAYNEGVGLRAFFLKKIHTGMIHLRAIPLASLGIVLFSLSACTPQILGERPSQKAARLARENAKAIALSWSPGASITSVSTLGAEWSLSHPSITGVRVEYFSGPGCDTSLNLDQSFSSAETSATLVAPSDGVYSFRVVTQTLNGAENPSSCSAPIEVDTTAPSPASTLAWQEGASANVLSLTPQWTASADSDLSSQTITYYSGAGCTGSALSLADLAPTLQNASFTGTDGGVYSFTVTSTDAAGNGSISACSSVVTVSLIDTPPSPSPSIASFAITTSSPGNTKTLALSYGAVTGSFSSYCIQVNSTLSTGCSWVDSTSLPASHSLGVGATDGNYVLTLLLKTPEGDISSPASTGTYTLDQTAPARPIVVSRTVPANSYHYNALSIPNTGYIQSNSPSILVTGLTIGNTVKLYNVSGNNDPCTPANLLIIFTTPITSATQSFSLSSLSNAAYFRIAASQVDPAGNESRCTSLSPIAGESAISLASFGVQNQNPAAVTGAAITGTPTQTAGVSATFTNPERVLAYLVSGVSCIGSPYPIEPDLITGSSITIGAGNIGYGAHSLLLRSIGISGLTTDTCLANFNIVKTIGTVDVSQPTDLSDRPLPSASPSGTPGAGEPYAASTLDFRWPVRFSETVDPATVSATAIVNCNKPGCALNVEFSLAPRNPDRPNFTDYYLRVTSIGGQGRIAPVWDLSAIESQDPQILTYSGGIAQSILYSGQATGGSEGTATSIPKLAYHAAAQDSANDLIYSFGGVTTTGLNGDLYRFSTSSPSGTWAKITTPRNGPQARMGAALAYFSGHLFLYGGKNEDGSEYFSDFWKYEISTNTWTKLEDSIVDTLGAALPRAHAAVIKKGDILEIRGGQVDDLTVSTRTLSLRLEKVLNDSSLTHYSYVGTASDFAFSASLIEEEFEHPYFGISAEDRGGPATALPSIYWLKTSTGYAEADPNLTPSNPTELFGGALAEPYQNQFYYMGGSADGGQASSGIVHRFTFDSSTSMVTSADEILTDPLLARFGAISFVRNGSVYLHGGYTDQGGSVQVSSDLIEYRPGLNLSVNLNASGAGILPCSCDPSLLAVTFGNPAGNGTESNPYEICSKEQITQLATNVGSPGYQSAHFRQCANIDYEGSTHTPIGDEGSTFAGTFDGNGYQISNVQINGSAKHLGFFGAVSGATLKNLNFVSPLMTVTEGTTISAGVLAGVAGHTSITSVIISNGTLSGSTGLDSLALGGLLGAGSAVTIQNSKIEVDITAQSSFAGGVAGHAVTCTLTGVTVMGNIVGNVAGGLIGLSKGSTISSSLVTGRITGNESAGGLISNMQGTTISDSAVYAEYIEAGGASPAGGIMGQCPLNCTLSRVISGSISIMGGAIHPFSAEGPFSGNDYVFWSNGSNPNWNNATPTVPNQQFLPGVALPYTDLIDLEAVNPHFDFTNTWKYWTTGTGANGFPIPRNAPSP